MRSYHVYPPAIPLHRPRSGLVQWAMLAGLAALLRVAWKSWRTTHHQRLAGRPERLPERLEVWEGEGGQSQMPAQSV
jgi:hypothetical protein